MTIIASIKTIALCSTGIYASAWGDRVTASGALAFSCSRSKMLGLGMAFVSESGQKKSPIFKTLIKDPLEQMKADAKSQYERDLAQYERGLVETVAQLSTKIRIKGLKCRSHSWC
ncbi:MAG: hypothetical protein SAK29_31380 [Scytonema sp. PMC 1069.18]|nr:hypothetical protein [Scytonema sp. PMC 1069.18]MEC4884340.1 hypothetical protein [Scytonema sp. PMC 1070.18]